MQIEQAAKVVFKIFKRNIPSVLDVEYRVTGERTFEISWEFEKIEFELDILDPRTQKVQVLCLPEFGAPNFDYEVPTGDQDTIPATIGKMKRASKTAANQFKVHLEMMAGVVKSLEEIQAMTRSR